MMYRMPMTASPDTLGMIELTSIAVGYYVADLMVKKAPVALHGAEPVCPGKFIILVSGDVASVGESVRAGCEASGKSLFGKLFIPNLSPCIVPAVNRKIDCVVEEAVGIVETFGAASAVLAADAAAKAADAKIQSITLVNGIGGKAFFILAGTLPDVEASVAGGIAVLDKRDLADSTIIPNIHGDVVRFFPGRS